MHLVFENVLKNLVLLWTGEFKGLNKGTGDYELAQPVWETIGTATAGSRKTIPGVFTASPPNVADEKSASTADTWSFWLMYLGPVLLAKKFQCRVYCDHFVKLAKLVRTCVQYEIT